MSFEKTYNELKDKKDKTTKEIAFVNSYKKAVKHTKKIQRVWNLFFNETPSMERCFIICLGGLRKDYLEAQSKLLRQKREMEKFFV